MGGYEGGLRGIDRAECANGVRSVSPLYRTVILCERDLYGNRNGIPHGHIFEATDGVIPCSRSLCPKYRFGTEAEGDIKIRSPMWYAVTIAVQIALACKISHVMLH
jgi:hypothetical protein